MMNHKKLLIGCGCALLAIALVVCLVLVIGNGAGDKPTLPSDGTTQATTPDGTTQATTPSGTTKPTGPNASEPTVPSSDPTTPSSGVTDPTVPTPPPTVGPGEQETTPPPTDPTTGEEIIPTENPNNNYTQPTGGTHEFGDINAGNVRASDWNSWSAERQQAFLDQFLTDDCTPEEMHNIILATWYNDYSCGMEGHSCKAQDYHDYLIGQMAKGCIYCGSTTDCPSFYGKDEYLFTRIVPELCPQYSVQKDPTEYCQKCGYKKLSKCEPGETGCTTVSSKDAPCYNCGEMRHVGECHNCVKKEK